MKLLYLAPVAAVLLFSLHHSGQAQVIDHTQVDAVAGLPQAVMDAIGGQRWLFTHASVGGNMINGLQALHAADPMRYQLLVTSVAYNDTFQSANPPGVTTGGTVYHCSRGNPGWSNKLTIFDNTVRVAGWHFASVDIVLDKFCYIDEGASAEDYLDVMADLEADYPETRFVYVTMPLTTGEDWDNLLRGEYNETVRQFCVSTNRLLFDIADIESHDPNGNACTFAYDGQTYQKLYSGYTNDGGHLNTLGQTRVGLGWYATGAALAVVPARVVDRHIFYNGSTWDGANAAATAADDHAIAHDKSALLPGQSATFGNYTSYSKGINGIMVDIANLADPAGLRAADFEFRTGNSSTLADWSTLELDPSQITIAVRSGEGTDGSDRVTILFPDRAVTKTWLEVSVRATAATGLAVPDVHYWGNAVADSGDSETNTVVDAKDALGVRANLRSPLRPAPIDDDYDYNRDRQVNVKDELLVRANLTSPLTDLKLIEP